MFCSVCCGNLVAAFLIHQHLPWWISPWILEKNEHREYKRFSKSKLRWLSRFGPDIEPISPPFAVFAFLLFASLPASMPSSPVRAHVIVSIWRAVFLLLHPPINRPRASQMLGYFHLNTLNCKDSYSYNYRNVYTPGLPRKKYIVHDVFLVTKFHIDNLTGFRFQNGKSCSVMLSVFLSVLLKVHVSFHISFCSTYPRVSSNRLWIVPVGQGPQASVQDPPVTGPKRK